MKLFMKGISKVFFYVISGALIIYAASRSLDFIVQTLPPNQQLIGYLALAATSGGMLAWLMVFLFEAEGMGQKITAGLMVGVDLLGEFGLFTMDTLYQSGQSGMTAALLPEEIRMVILAMSGLIALNILATVIFHLVQSENIRNMRESFVRDRLENEALNLIEKRGEELARSIAPVLAESWAADFEARFSDLRALGLGSLERKDHRKQRTNPNELFSVSWLQQDKNNPQLNENEQIRAPVLEAPGNQSPLPLVGMSNNGHGKST